MTEPAPSSSQPEYVCPNCGEPLDPAQAHQGVMDCPHCGQAVSLATDDELQASSVSGSELSAPRLAPDDDELSGVKIRQIADLRRGAVRTRSWLFISIFACAVGAIQLIFLAISGYRAGLRLAAGGDVAAAVLALLLSLYFGKRAIAAHREIQQSHLEEPQTPPDFSTLSNGNQYSANLEKMSDSSFEN